MSEDYGENSLEIRNRQESSSNYNNNLLGSFVQFSPISNRVADSQIDDLHTQLFDFSVVQFCCATPNTRSKGASFSNKTATIVPPGNQLHLDLGIPQGQKSRFESQQQLQQYQQQQSQEYLDGKHETLSSARNRTKSEYNKTQKLRERVEQFQQQMIQKITNLKSKSNSNHHHHPPPHQHQNSHFLSKQQISHTKAPSYHRPSQTIYQLQPTSTKTIPAPPNNLSNNIQSSNEIKSQQNLKSKSPVGKRYPVENAKGGGSSGITQQRKQQPIIMTIPELIETTIPSATILPIPSFAFINHQVVPTATNVASSQKLPDIISEQQSHGKQNSQLFLQLTSEATRAGEQALLTDPAESSREQLDFSSQSIQINLYKQTIQSNEQQQQQQNVFQQQQKSISRDITPVSASKSRSQLNNQTTKNEEECHRKQILLEQQQQEQISNNKILDSPILKGIFLLEERSTKETQQQQQQQVHSPKQICLSPSNREMVGTPKKYMNRIPQLNKEESLVSLKGRASDTISEQARNRLKSCHSQHQQQQDQAHQQPYSQHSKQSQLSNTLNSQPLAQIVLYNNAIKPAASASTKEVKGEKSLLNNEEKNKTARIEKKVANILFLKSKFEEKESDRKVKKQPSTNSTSKQVSANKVLTDSSVLANRTSNQQLLFQQQNEQQEQSRSTCGNRDSNTQLFTKQRQSKQQTSSSQQADMMISPVKLALQTGTKSINNSGNKAEQNLSGIKNPYALQFQLKLSAQQERQSQYSAKSHLSNLNMSKSTQSLLVSEVKKLSGSTFRGSIQEEEQSSSSPSHRILPSKSVAALLAMSTDMGSSAEKGSSIIGPANTFSTASVISGYHSSGSIELGAPAAPQYQTVPVLVSTHSNQPPLTPTKVITSNKPTSISLHMKNNINIQTTTKSNTSAAKLQSNDQLQRSNSNRVISMSSSSPSPAPPIQVQLPQEQQSQQCQTPTDVYPKWQKGKKILHLNLPASSPLEVKKGQRMLLLNNESKTKNMTNNSTSSTLLNSRQATKSPNQVSSSSKLLNMNSSKSASKLLRTQKEQDSSEIPNNSTNSSSEYDQVFQYLKDLNKNYLKTRDYGLEEYQTRSSVGNDLRKSQFKEFQPNIAPRLKTPDFSVGSRIKHSSSTHSNSMRQTQSSISEPLTQRSSKTRR